MNNKNGGSKLPPYGKNNYIVILVGKGLAPSYFYYSSYN